MKHYQAIIYDIDGTLLDTLRMNMIPLQRIIEEETAVSLTYEEVLKYASYPGLKVLNELKIENPEIVYERWVSYVNNFEEGAIAFEGIEELLMGLHERYKQAVVSAKTRKQYKIDFTELEKYIDVAVLSDDTLLHKPHPEPILKCLELLGIQACDCLYVGDALSDYRAAKAAQVDFAYATWGSVSFEEIDEPTMVIHHPLELLECLLSHD